MRTKITGAVLCALGFVSAYFYILGPLRHASGELHQALCGLVGPMFLFYAGLSSLVTDARDEKTMYIGTDGRLKWTRTARFVVWGIPILVAVTILAWYCYVHFLGLGVVISR